MNELMSLNWTNKEGSIRLESDLANDLGFTPDKFSGYLWFDKNTEVFTVSLITSLHPGKGNVRKLLDTLKSRYKIIHIPTPSERMKYIALKAGFKECILESDPDDPFDLGSCRGMKWVKEE